MLRLQKTVFILTLSAIGIGVGNADVLRMPDPQPQAEQQTVLSVEMPARGMTMDMGTSKMINAAREYRQGAKELNAMMFLGNQAMAQGSMQAMKTETAEAKMSISTIDGFKVQKFHDKIDNSGGVMVRLSQNQQQGAMFILEYKGLSAEEGLKAAKKFNWKEMKNSVDKLF